ncbi:MAG TPA: sigma-54 dependent transcriptional regulator [Opitutaceae bacterium]|jgi:nitrogen regulation protein NR(I)|nr:sigma-54 dependent transcriptional regulator [Opitutaceae bacterium]
MSIPYKICLIDDDSAARTALERVLIQEGYEVGSYPDGKLGLAAALDEDCDCVLTDLRMPGVSGLELIDTLREELPNLPVVLMTAHGTTETAIEATRRGAFDYILKPFEMSELLSVVSHAAAAGQRGREKIALGAEQPVQTTLIGQSRVMQNVYKEIGRVAGKPISVVIIGETGTGKELVTRALWQYSDRKDKSFVAVNCAAIPANLLESELFGHERGAFTGAESRRIGRFEQANGGMLFLDEIGDLSLETQAKLLRVLQERVISRLGGRESIPVDVRVIAATHRDMPVLVASGKFREDLWYRLNVVSITLPPLRDRREDIPALIKYFVNRYGAELSGVAAVQPPAMKFLSAQPWPGNVRQLENVVKRMLLLAHGYPITEGLARTAITQGPSSPSAESAGRTLAAYCEEALAVARSGSGTGAVATVLAGVEIELLMQANAATVGNITQMARLLGWSRFTVRAKMKQYGLQR